MLPTDGYPQTNSLRIVPPDVDCGFKIFDKPHPRIAKALLGPFLVENSKVRVDLPMRCLAVNAEGTYADFLTVDPHQLRNPAAMWKHIAWVLHLRWGQPTAARHWQVGHTIQPTDCLKTWTASSFWDCSDLDRWSLDEYRLPYGKKASDKSSWQPIIRDCVSETLLALDPRLRRLLYARPLIGMGIVRILLDLAAQRGSAAIDHTWAALMREPLPLLYLMASEKPSAVARRVRNAVFKGGDLAGLLKRMGIPEQTYKRTRRSDQCGHDEELDVGWRWTWFDLLKTTRRNPPTSDDDWQEFRTLLRPDRGLNSATSVIALCIEKGYKQCNQHWNLIHEAGIQLKNALEVATGEIGIPGYVIDFDSNVAAHCKIVQSLQKGNDLLKIHPPENTNWVKDVTDAWIFNIEMMEQHVFDATPEIPDQLHIPELFSLKKLFRSTITEDKDFFDWIESYSDAVGNYLLTKEGLQKSAP